MTTHCDKATACDSDLTASYSFDTHRGNTNFITEVPELLCYSDAMIGLQGTIYFIGQTVGSVLWMRLADLWGHKWITAGGLVLCLLTHLLYFLQVSVPTIYATMALFGLGSLINFLVSYLLLV